MFPSWVIARIEPESDNPGRMINYKGTINGHLGCIVDGRPRYAVMCCWSVLSMSALYGIIMGEYEFRARDQGLA